MKINNPVLTPEIVFDEYYNNSVPIEVCDEIFLKYGWEYGSLVNFFNTLNQSQLHKIYSELIILKNETNLHK
jgi:hypothetical protein